MNTSDIRTLLEQPFFHERFHTHVDRTLFNDSSLYHFCISNAKDPELEDVIHKICENFGFIYDKKNDSYDDILDILYQNTIEKYYKKIEIFLIKNDTESLKNILCDVRFIEAINTPRTNNLFRLKYEFAKHASPQSWEILFNSDIMRKYLCEYDKTHIGTYMILDMVRNKNEVLLKYFMDNVNMHIYYEYALDRFKTKDIGLINTSEMFDIVFKYIPLDNDENIEVLKNIITECILKCQFETARLLLNRMNKINFLSL